MAGDGGLLAFDGQDWKQFQGSEGFTRSLLVANDSLIYSGSDFDFGVWKKNELNQFNYRSLYPFREDPTEESEEFWDVFQINEGIAFISASHIYWYKNEQLTKIVAPHRFSGAFQGRDRIYLADQENSLLTFDGRSLKTVFTFPDNPPLQIAGVFERQAGLVVVTQSKGLFLFRDDQLVPMPMAVSGYLKQDQVFCATMINESYFAFGTILNGLYITDLEGNIIQHINKKKGLPNNTVLAMHFSPDGLLWLGMDYGISTIHIYAPITYFFDYMGEFGTAYAALLKDGVFYLGTNQGLYQAAWQDLNNQVVVKPFRLIPGSEGQVWSLQTIDGTLYCGHNRGLFTVRGNTFQQVNNEPGVWTILPFQKDYLLTGNYNGISIFRRAGNTFSFWKKMELILGSCNQVMIEKDNLLWVNIPKYGLIRFSLNENLSPSERMIFPSTLFKGNAFYLKKEDNGIHLYTSTNHYRFLPEKKQFGEEESKLPPITVTGILEGIYKPTPIDGEYQFYSVYNGFALESISAAQRGLPVKSKLIVSKIEAFNNQESQLMPNRFSTAYMLNNLRFHFVIPHQKQALYQYQLEGFSEQWSAWSTSTSLEFTSLKEGDYVLRLRATVQGQATPITEVFFSIMPPWYRTKWAYAGYLALVVLFFYLNRQWHQVRLRKQRVMLLEQEKRALQQQAEAFEQEAWHRTQQQLEKEKKALQQQVKQKSIELTKKAKENEDKNRLLYLLKEKMDQVQGEPKVNKARWAEMQRMLESYLESNDKVFEIQIDELHQEFFNALREQFPDLSVYDMRLCAYLKMGLNSKEIADMLQVLPSSINVSRSRLRKKLNLQPDEDLHRFLNGIV